MSFACLGTLQIPSPSKLFRSACCPDKDLIVLVSRLAGQDRLTLWNYSQGSKIWEVNLGGNDGDVVEVVGLAWSPDGQSIAVAQEPPQVTIHSVQDGSKLLNLTLEKPGSFDPPSVTGIWWFKDREPPSRVVPDVFRRGNIITGSAQSIFRALPRLDRFQPEMSRVTATDLFAFQGSQTKSPTKSADMPDFIESWPNFTVAPFMESLYATSPETKNTEQDGVVDTFNRNSLLLVAAKYGDIHLFVDGAFPLGAISLGVDIVASASRDPEISVLSVHPGAIQGTELVQISLYPTLIDMPLIESRKTRDLGELSTLAKELTSYVLRVVKDMKSSWFGSESMTGARELGPKWVEALESRQRNQFGQHEPDGILDLTALLVTGRASDSLLDFLGSGEHMSERGLRKWETIMIEALIKLREFSEYRVSPACQRLYLILEELKGWEQLPQFSAFQLSKLKIDQCLDMTHQMILLTASLVSHVRRELDWFKEFISWLKFETLAANPSTESPPQPRHDTLEVNGYITNSLSTNTTDTWFEGPLPETHYEDDAVSKDLGIISAALRRAWSAVEDPSWGSKLSAGSSGTFIGKNLEALANRLASHCKDIFTIAASAPCRSSSVIWGSNSLEKLSAHTQNASEEAFTTRERIVEDTQYLAISLVSRDPACLCLGRIESYNRVVDAAHQVGVALVGRTLLLDGDKVEIDLLDADFFDDHSLIAVFRLRGQNGFPIIGVLEYDNLEFYPIQSDISSAMLTQQDLVVSATAQVEAGQIPLLTDSFKHTQELTGLKADAVSLALNGTVGRRVACVLDSQGTTLQSFDMEGGSGGTEDLDEEEGA